ncbi:class I SAM-dependent methyltransferase [Cryptosporangium minutisporangium]|uniref:Methyltransferase domain-containing protein n=1 Tax=Cryptosporangium minutisporangium TaxID=113569 RepID=A0ABP6T9T9_9ACTN
MLNTSVHFPDQLAFWNDWHARRGATGDDPGHRESRRVFLDLLAESASRRVLDLGCGQGHDVAAFAQGGLDAHGLDYSPVAVRQAREALRRVGGSDAHGRVRCHDLVEPLPYADRAFDGIFSHLAIQYFDEPTTQAICLEAARVLRPGGVLVLVVKSVDDPYCGQGDRLAHHTWLRKGRIRRFFTEHELKDLLADWAIDRIDSYSGQYASPEQSHFLRLVARRSF